jgi:branched-chain amino acid transport system substrate-binding protein
VARADGGGDDGGPPFWAETALRDVGNAYLSALAVVQALYDRQRTRGGPGGQHLTRQGLSDRHPVHLPARRWIRGEQHKVDKDLMGLRPCTGCTKLGMAGPASRSRQTPTGSVIFSVNWSNDTCSVYWSNDTFSVNWGTTQSWTYLQLHRSIRQRRRTQPRQLRAWANTVNAGGGLEGHPIQMTAFDDTSTPGTSVSDVQTLISDHVDVIVDTSLVDSTWAPAVQAAGIPVLCALIQGTCYSNPDFYDSGQTGDSSAFAAVAVAKAAGATNIGFLYCAEAPACSEGISVVKAAGKQLGVPENYSASIAATAPNYTAQCVAAQQAHTTALFIGDTTPPIEKVGQDCSTQGYNPIYVTEGGGFSMAQATTPGLKKNLWSEYNLYPFWSNAPQVQAMNTALDKYYPGLRENTVSFSEGSVLGWTSGLLLNDAVKAGGLTASATPSAAEITAGLESLHGDTLDGWSPPLTFPAGKVHPIDCWFVGHVSNGVPSVENNGKPTCGSLSS